MAPGACEVKPYIIDCRIKIGNGARGPYVASGCQCSINQHLLSDHLTGTLAFQKSSSAKV